MASTQRSVAVLGAGIVGVACALELQRRGLDVVLVDRNLPGRETSYGNAGVLARSSLVPFNRPGLWRSLPALLTNRSAGFRYRPTYLARNAAWGMGFLARARPTPYMQTATALDSLIRLSTAEHRRLLGEAGESHRLRENGWIFLYRSEDGFAASRPTRDTLDAFGVSTQVLDAKGVSDLEPSLQPIFPRSLWIRDGASVDSPGGVVAAYARLFAQRGGRIVKDEVRHLSRADDRWFLHGAREQMVASRVVVALGPWAKQMLTGLGLKVPMAFERGYHMHFGARGGAGLHRPVYDTAAGYVMSPMESGIRLTTGVELDDIEAPKSLAQLEVAEVSAREAFPLGDRLEDDAWMGCRPTLPDSRPLIGPVPRLPGLWLAFGHQHIGFSTSTGTALLLGAMMQGEPPPIDARPFEPSRFVA